MARPTRTIAKLYLPTVGLWAMVRAVQYIVKHHGTGK